MDLKTLSDIPPWEWPEEAEEIFLEYIRDKNCDLSQRLLAVEHAGDFTVINEEISEALLKLLTDNSEPAELRATAAISFGPVLAQADTDGFEDDFVPISEDTFKRIQQTLHSLYKDTQLPTEVRRRVLEASVRAEQDWHPQAVQDAYSSVAHDWKLTAIFCMQYVSGFDKEIIEELHNSNLEIRIEAIQAAGNWALDQAWPYIVEIVSNKNSEKELLLCAMEALASIHPREAESLLRGWTNSQDKEIAETAEEAITLASLFAEEDGFTEDDGFADEDSLSEQDLDDEDDDDFKS
jgi:uncharacterized protein (UPF0147 family)